MINEKEYMGVNDWVWWLGIVEDTYDPIEMGRLKVRVFGYYNDDKQALPTEDLPWCYQVMPTTSASHDTHGATSGINIGSWVVGWFMDGRKGQFPICFGTIHGIHDTGIAPGSPGAGGYGPGSGGYGPGSGGTPGSIGEVGPTTGLKDVPTSGSWTMNQRIALLKANGASDALAVQLAAIATPESGGDPSKFNGRGRDRSYGMFQINMIGDLGPSRAKALGINDYGGSHPNRYKDLFDPNTNARAAVLLATNNLPNEAPRGLNHWSTYGVHRNYVPAAQAALDSGGWKSFLDNDGNFDTAAATDEELETQYDENQTACSADSMPKRYHSVEYPTSTKCDEKNPKSNQSQDKVDELDKTNGQWQKQWWTGDMDIMQNWDAKDLGRGDTLFNQITTSPGGNFVNYWDDTPGAERWGTIQLPTGTMEEVDALGNREVRTRGTEVNSVLNNSYKNVEGNHTVTAKNMSVLTHEEHSIRSLQGLSIHSDGAGGVIIESPGPITFKSTQQITLEGSSIGAVATDGDINVKSAGEFNQESAKGMNFNAGPGANPGQEGGFSFDSAGPITMAATTLAVSTEASVKFESPDINFMGGNMKVDTLSVDDTYSTILNWDQTVSTSKFSKYADEAVVAKGIGGNAQAGDHQEGAKREWGPGQPKKLYSGTFNSPPEGDPAYPGEKKSGPQGTSMVTRFKEFKDLITQGGKVRGGQRDLGSGGRGVAGHSNIGATSRGLGYARKGVDTPDTTRERFAPRTTDAFLEKGVDE